MRRNSIVMEWKEVLLGSSRPSVYFEELRSAGQLYPWFQELESLISIEQDVRHHPEGSVWNHTMMVLDVCAGFRTQAENPLGLMLSALCHDFGKAVTTEKVGDRIHSYGHEKKGLPLVKQFLDRITDDPALKEYVLNMTELHMRPNALVRQNAGKQAYRKMFRAAVCPADLLLLAKADHMGRGKTFAYDETEDMLQKYLVLYEESEQTD